MKVSFHGACREVTGSCILIETDKTKFLVDCGMFQGVKFADEKNAKLFDFDPKEIDFVLLTHAHMDHCGRLPKLYKEGFRGKVFSTDATRDFSQLMLLDSARIITEEAQRENREPFYLDWHVRAVMNHFTSIDYNKIQKATKDIKFKMKDAGHILGSAIIEVWVKEGGQDKKLVFSGDLGNPPAPIIRDPEFIDSADCLFIESTYGGRIHEPKAMRRQLLKEAIMGSVGRGGVLMIPSFALERTQEILYELNHLVETKKVPVIPIFLDSPLAIKATAVYKKHQGMYDKDSKDLIVSGDDFLDFPGLKFTRTVSQSKHINHVHPPKVILAGSGMCTGGRIPHHLKRNLDNPKSHLLIISYQAVGSLGRKLFDGIKKVKIDGEWVKVKAKVSAIGSYSSHADQPQLLHWVKKMNKKPSNIFIIHGEEKGNLMLADGLKQKLNLNSIIPEYKNKYEI